MTKTESPPSPPIRQIDHLRITVADLAVELKNYAVLFGAEPLWQGTVAGEPSALFDAGNTHVWLAESKQPQGLTGICFQVDALERQRRRLQRVGVALAKSAGPDPLAGIHGDAQSTCAERTAPESSRGLALSFVERGPAGNGAPPTLVTGLDHIVIASQNAEATAFLLAAQLGLDMRMDMTRPEWQARLMFFCCGDLIVEVFQKLGAKETSATDSFFGLSWRVKDADVARAQLADSGFDVSEVRTGRRPGTRVLTVRNRTAGVATLLLEPPPH